MAEEAGSSVSKQSFDIKALGLIEKASDFHWMLQIVALALFVDSALLLSKGKNLINYSWVDFNFSSELNLVLIAGLSYSVLVSAVIPIIGGVVGYTVRFFYYQFIYLHVRDRDSAKRWRNQVSYYELKEHADRTQSTYARAAYEAWENVEKKIEGEKIKLERAAFRTLILLGSGFYLSAPGNPSTITELSKYVSHDAYMFSTMATLGILVYLCCASWCKDWYQSKWISYAPLYDEIMEKREAEKKRMEDFEKESYQRMRIKRNLD